MFLISSPVTNADFDANAYLGGTTIDASGRITVAKAAIFTYFMQGTNSSNTEYVEEDEVSFPLFSIKFINSMCLTCFAVMVLSLTSFSESPSLTQLLRNN